MDAKRNQTTASSQHRNVMMMMMSPKNETRWPTQDVIICCLPFCWGAGAPWRVDVFYPLSVTLAWGPKLRCPVLSAQNGRGWHLTHGKTASSTNLSLWELPAIFDFQSLWPLKATITIQFFWSLRGSTVVFLWRGETVL